MRLGSNKTFAYFVSRDEVDEDCVQQLLRHSISLHDDGTHQVQHVHLHLLIMAVTGRGKSPYQKEYSCVTEETIKLT